MAPQLKTVKISFNGGLDLRSTTQELQSKPGVATQLVNFEQDIAGGYRRINGYSPIGTGVIPGTGKIKGIQVYGTGYVACRGDNIYHSFDGLTWLQVNKDLDALADKAALEAAPELARTDSGMYTFDTFTQGDEGGREDLLIHDSQNSPSVLTIIGTDHDTAEYRYKELSIIEKGSQGLVHDDQHIVTGDSTAPSTFYVSAIADMEDFEGSLSGQYSVAEPIIGLASFREILYIFCRSSIWKATNLNNTETVIEPVTRNVGCVDPATIQEIGGDIIFLATDGLRTLGATERIGDVNLTTVSSPINKLMRDILQDRQNYTFCSTVIREKSQYRLFYVDELQPSKISKGVIATYYTNTETPWSFSEIDGMTVTSVDSGVISGADVHIHGDTSGKVYFHDVGSLFNTKAIHWTLQSPSIDLGDVGLRKNMHDLSFYTEQDGILGMDAKVIYDYDRSNIHQPDIYNIVQLDPPASWGITPWGSGFWQRRAVTIDKLHVQGSCTTVAVRLTNNTISTNPFTIQGFDINYTESGRI